MKMSVLAFGLLMFGAASLRAQEPICVIDGVRVPSAVCSRAGGLTPDRIESITILKGEAAAREYGAQAADGVIRITTKDGLGLTGAVVEDPLTRALFPPEQVMAHQQAISLTTRQRSAILEAMQEAQSRFVELRFALSAEVEKLQALLEPGQVDEAAVLEQVNRVLDAERAVKRTQLTMMVRIKNQLTAEQQERLRALRR